MIPYLRTENLENHTLFRGMYLYSPYMGVPPGVRCNLCRFALINVFKGENFIYLKQKVVFVSDSLSVVLLIAATE